MKVSSNTTIVDRVVNAELGRKLAYEDAVRQLWPLMGFALREKLSAAA